MGGRMRRRGGRARHGSPRRCWTSSAASDSDARSIRARWASGRPRRRRGGRGRKRHRPGRVRMRRGRRWTAAGSGRRRRGGEREGTDGQRERAGSIDPVERRSATTRAERRAGGETDAARGPGVAHRERGRRRVASVEVIVVRHPGRVTDARTRDRVVVHRANGNGRNFRDQSISSESQAAFSRSDRQATQTAEEEIRARRGVGDWTRATRLLRRLASSY